MDGGDRLEELRGLRDGHLQHLGDVLALVAHLERLAVVARALTHLARHVHVRQEVHLDLDGAVAVAGLAATALDVEGEAPGLVAAHLGLLGLGEQVADLVEHAGVRRRVGARGTPDRALVHLHELVQVLQPFDLLHPAGNLARAVELILQRLRQNLVHQRGFAGAGHAGHGHQHAERDVHADVVQVVLSRADDLQLPLLIDVPPVLRHLDHLAASQVVARDGVLGLENAFRLALVDHFPAVLAGARADVDEPVGFTDGVLVVLHHDQRVAQVAQLFQRGDQALVVALVQADGRLVQHVKHTSQAGTDLGGQADALRLAARQRAGGAGQGEVVQPHVQQEMQACLDFAQHGTCDHFFAVAQHQVVQVLGGVLDGKLSQARDGQLPVRGRRQAHSQDLRLQTRTVTRRARHLAGVREQAFLLRFGLGLLQLALQVAHDALVGRRVRALAPVAVLVAHVDLRGRSVDQVLLLRLGQRAQRRVGVEVLLFRQRLDEFGEVFLVRAGVPRLERVHRGCVRVRDDQVHVDLLAHAQAVAGRAGAERRVEGERARLVLLHVELVAVRAGHLLGEDLHALRVVGVQFNKVEADKAVGKLERRLHGIRQALLLAGLDGEAVHHHVDVVLDLLFQLRRVRELVGLPVHVHARVALRRQVGEEVLELALALAHNRREHLELGALFQLEHAVHDLLRGLALNHRVAHRAVRGTCARVQKAQVVIDLRDGAHGGARVAVGGLLVDGHCRAQPVDVVHVRLVHLA